MPRLKLLFPLFYQVLKLEVRASKSFDLDQINDSSVTLSLMIDLFSHYGISIAAQQALSLGT